MAAVSLVIQDSEPSPAPWPDRVKTQGSKRFMNININIAHCRREFCSKVAQTLFSLLVCPSYSLVPTYRSYYTHIQEVMTCFYSWPFTTSHPVSMRQKNAKGVNTTKQGVEKCCDCRELFYFTYCSYTQCELGVL